MNKNHPGKTILTVMVVLITGVFAVQAFAHMGGHHRGGGGFGHHGAYGNQPGCGPYGSGPAWNKLAGEEREQFLQEREKFFAATQELRNQYQAKRLALSNEYAREKTDPARIRALEKELFEISAKLDKARFEHRLTMQEKFGDNAAGFSRKGYKPGYGRGGCF
ncbi:MAG: periplasmic heavy metal sensor [Desulfosudaceae bacterium]